MRYANDYDIENYLQLYARKQPLTPNLGRLAVVLSSLRNWVNCHSDGWAYWAPPLRAANQVITVLDETRTAYLRGSELTDIDEARAKRALTPIKRFLTTQGVAYDQVRGLDPEADEAAVKARLAAQWWTLFGHWDDAGELIIDHAVKGQHQDIRPDDGEYEGGLWADSAQGATLAEAEAAVRAEYETVVV